MWTRSFSVITNKVTASQMWALFSDVNQWNQWDSTIEYAQMTGQFEAGNHFFLRPKGGPTVKIKLIHTESLFRFTDLTKFPLAEMTGDHTFETTPEGLKITTTMSVKGILSFLWIKLVAQKIVDGLPEDIERQIEAAQRL